MNPASIDKFKRELNNPQKIKCNLCNKNIVSLVVCYKCQSLNMQNQALIWSQKHLTSDDDKETKLPEIENKEVDLQPCNNLIIL